MPEETEDIDWEKIGTEEEPKKPKSEASEKKETKAPSKPDSQKTTESSAGMEKKGSKKVRTLTDAFNPVFVNKFLEWVPKQNANKYPRQKAVINQFKAYNKGNTFIQLLDLFQIFLAQDE